MMAKYLARHDWLVWLDCDSFFMNDARPITDILPDPGTDLGAVTDFLISEDGATLNTGTCCVQIRARAWWKRREREQECLARDVVRITVCLRVCTILVDSGSRSCHCLP